MYVSGTKKLLRDMLANGDFWRLSEVAKVAWLLVFLFIFVF